MTRLSVPLTALSLAICLGPHDAAAGTSAPRLVAEIVTFRLVDGAEPQAFVEAAMATAPLVAAQPGFVRRSLSLDATGLWTDHVEWADLASAETAARVVIRAPAFAPFAGMIAVEGMSMRHAAILWRMGD